MVTAEPLVLSYLFPIVLGVLAVVGVSVVLSLVHRAGTRRDPDPAVEAALRRRRRLRSR